MCIYIYIYICIYIYIYTYIHIWDSRRSSGSAKLNNTSQNYKQTIIESVVRSIRLCGLFTPLRAMGFLIWLLGMVERDPPRPGSTPGPCPPRTDTRARSHIETKTLTSVWERGKLSCDVHIHTPAQKSYTNLPLYPFVVYTCSIRWLGHGRGYEWDSSQAQNSSWQRSGQHLGAGGPPHM